MNGYICFYGNRRIEVYAATTYEAQIAAATALGVKVNKRYKISVTLAEKGGPTGPEIVTHVAVD